MGWSSGSDLLEEVLRTVLPFISTSEKRKIITKRLIQHFENYDCDTIYELADSRVAKKYPELKRLFDNNE